MEKVFTVTTSQSVCKDISTIMTMVKSQRNSIVHSAGSISGILVMIFLLMLPLSHKAIGMISINRMAER